MTPNSLLSRKGGTSSKRDEYFGITNLVEHPAQLNPPGIAPSLVHFAVRLETKYSYLSVACSVLAGVAVQTRAPHHRQVGFDLFGLRRGHKITT